MKYVTCLSSGYRTITDKITKLLHIATRGKSFQRQVLACRVTQRRKCEFIFLRNSRGSRYNPIISEPLSNDVHQQLSLNQFIVLCVTSRYSFKQLVVAVIKWEFLLKLYRKLESSFPSWHRMKVADEKFKGTRERLDTATRWLLAHVNWRRREIR